MIHTLRGIRDRELHALDATIEWYVQNTAWWHKIKSGEFKKYYAAQYGSRL